MIKIVTSNEEIKMIVDRYNNGFSSREIGKELNISNVWIRKLLRRNNIEIRNQSIANKLSRSVKRGKEHPNFTQERKMYKDSVVIRYKGKRIKESHYNWCIANGMTHIPKGMIIHHRDMNKWNNSPDNLVMIDQSTHVIAHNIYEKIKEMQSGGWL